MKDECYRAKLWLSRTFDLMSKLEAEKRTLMVLQNKLGSGVRNYDSFGSPHDVETSIRIHESLLIEFSLQNERIEQTQSLIFKELDRTRSVLDKLSKPLYQAIATDRYINNLKWKDIEKNYHYGSSELFRIHDLILLEVYQLLAPAIVEETDESINREIGA